MIVSALHQDGGDIGKSIPPTLHYLLALATEKRFKHCVLGGGLKKLMFICA